MKLEFNPESKVTEWANGKLHFTNKSNIDVTSSQARHMLRQMHEVEAGQFVPVFVLADDQGKVTKKEAAESLGTYPDNFPHADVLTRAGMSFDAVRVLDKESLLKLDGVGPKSAEAILTAIEGAK
jgi:hypothetical protein